MSDVLSVMLPIVLVIGLGLFAVRAGAASDENVDGLARFVMNFALPAVIFSALVQQNLRDSFNLAYIAAYGGGSLVAFAATFAALRAVRGQPLTFAAMGALGASASNTGYIGYPVASLALGAGAVAALPMTMLVENLLVIPLAMILAEVGSSDGSQALPRVLRQTAVRLATMPLLLAIAVGTVFSLLDLRLPASLMSAIGMLAGASAPCALFVVGGTIARLQRSDVTPDVFMIVGGKLLLHPLAVSVALLLVPGVPPTLAAVGMLLSSVSMITIYPIFCGRFGLAKPGATALVVATMLGLATTTAMLWLVLP